MVSFIVIAKEKTEREAYIKSYANKYKIDQFDITLLEKDWENKGSTQSIGIEAVKILQKKLFFKPLKSANKLISIEDAHLLTTEAQNALLKVLEEPPENTFIILGAETKESLLPTILSRCQVVELEEKQKKLSEKTIEELTFFIQNLHELSISDLLKQAELLAKDKKKAVDWTEDLILLLRETLLKSYSLSEDAETTEPRSSVTNSEQTNFRQAQIIRTLKSFQSLHKLLKTTNVNPRFAIEHTLLSI